MKYFEFSAHGNHSYTFNWDDGMTVGSVKEISLKQREEMLENEYFSPCELGEGITRLNYNSHGGSTTMDGIIEATSFEAAEEILEKYLTTNYKVVEYEG